MEPDNSDSLLRRVIADFFPRFAPGGRVIYRDDAESRNRDQGGYAMPGAVIESQAKTWLVLVEVAATREPISERRKIELTELFGDASRLVLVSAVESRAQLAGWLPAWDTVVWVADEPDHLIHFDTRPLFGPYPIVLPVA